MQWLRSIQIDELEPGISGSGVIDSDNALFGGGCKTFNRCIAIITFYVNGDENKVFKAEISLIQSPRIGWIVYKWQSRVNGITQTHSVRFMGGLNTDNLTLVNRCPPNPCDSRFFYWPFRSLESDL